MASKAPLTKRGIATRRAILDGARTIFERDGFLDARIVDICDAGNTAIGTFYRYFDSKEAVFDALLEDLRLQIDSSQAVGLAATNPFRAIRVSNEQFLRSYAENSRFIAVFEQAAMMSDTIRAVRRDFRARFVERVQRSIARLQTAGFARDVDSRIAANALVSMINNFAYTWLVLGVPEERDVVPVAEQLSVLWMRALGVSDEHIFAEEALNEPTV